ncbi:unnamed protein product (macronuclear) [Paramecium tetraurelia]|uniref:Uncharacterized protein n=1 Tax=Paramecium tetraurelia TaxID=5888 RepID=A0DFD2_PARTE|nr:uncharacterized protein GSPATT00016562001 [Paramecium tetraurelia]CAK81749.1 unnamed protein product [Paramecium tetraurelia]|eukprot:XP_001449146.1 hypothetical protein (macronuclear) [Paramecium tetraurelia strain d4-2]
MSDQEEESPRQDEFGQRIIKLKELTPLEKEYFDKARQRHKDNIYKDQIVQGRKFEGVAFISKPAEIIFKDFDVGKPHTIIMQLTNVSYTFNSFKILPLPEAVRDFFELIYTPPGRVSAGMSCPITVRFTPQLNDDIDVQLQCQAETGPFQIHILCTSKKAIAKVEQPIIDFGKVILGEDSTLILKIQNLGALDTDVIIRSAKGIDLQTIATESVSQKSNRDRPFDEEGILPYLKQLKFQRQHVLQGYSMLKIPIQYIPAEVGPFSLPLTLYYENFLHSPPCQIEIRGYCTEVPIYVEKQIYNFQICLFNHIYREKIVFFNRSQNAMKIQIQTPKETKDFFEFNPKLGYIQGNSKFEIWVKFNAERQLQTICQRFFKDNVIDVPFKLIGADQKMPVPFNIVAQMTMATLQITPARLDFGKLFDGQGAKRAITFENLSDLPQELAIYPLPKEISITTDLVPLRLLPKQKFTTDIIYRTQKVIGISDRQDEGILKCKIVSGTISTKEIRIPYTCEISKCPLEFSGIKFDIPVQQIDEKYSTTIDIKNISQRDIIIEFFLPFYELCGLRMAPMVQQIQRDQLIQVHLEYDSFFKKLGAYTLQELKEKYENDPNNNFELRLKIRYEEEERKKREQEELKKEEEMAAKGKAAKKEVKKDQKKPEKLTKAQQQQLEEDERRQAELEKLKQEEERLKREEFEKQFDSAKELRNLGGTLVEFNKPEDLNYSQHYSWLIPCYFKYTDMPDNAKQVIYLQISTVTVQKSLLLSKTIIDFGEVAVGIRQTKELTVFNQTPFKAELKMEMLPISCGFTILNALRTIEPSNKKSLIVQFQPTEDQPFEETLKLYCNHAAVSAKLKGIGVRPEVKVVPENGLISVGGVVLGEYAERTFKITNVSNFPIKFQLISKARGVQNSCGTEVFQFIPQEAIVNAQQEITCKVIFKPDRVSDKFYDLISVHVPNQKSEKRVFIWGYCYNRQAYVNIYQPYNLIPQINEINKKIEFPFDQLKLKDEEKVYTYLNNKIMLEFEKLKEEDNSRKIVIGSCKLLDPKMEKPVNYEVILSKDEKYFVCDNQKGAIQPGNEVVITFTFKPPQPDQFIASIEALKKIGQWKETKIELKISGGFLKAGVQDNISYELILKAFINQI